MLYECVIYICFVKKILTIVLILINCIFFSDRILKQKFLYILGCIACRTVLENCVGFLQLFHYINAVVVHSCFLDNPMLDFFIEFSIVVHSC